MRILQAIRSLAIVCACLLVCLSCEDEPMDNPCDIAFDQQQMFSDIAREVIRPQLDSLMQATDSLQEAADDFVQTPTVSNLESVRDAYLDSYKRWQHVRMFSFGPAEEVMLVERVNSFPLEVDDLQENISSDSVDFTDPANKYTRGFPALDYLLYGLESDETSIAMRYEQETALREYLIDNLEFMKESFDHVDQAWEGAYSQTFTNNTGTAEGTSLSLLINHLNLRYEELRRNKLGIPSGIAALGIEHPEKVEAYYSGYSLELLEASIIGMNRAFNGANAQGLDDYLEAANARTTTDEPLVEVIREQFDTSLEKLRNIPPTLAESIENDNAAVEEAYQALARQTVHLKTDMPAALCVSITYVDNPSDSD